MSLLQTMRALTESREVQTEATLTTAGAFAKAFSFPEKEVQAFMDTGKGGLSIFKPGNPFNDSESAANFAWTLEAAAWAGDDVKDLQALVMVAYLDAREREKVLNDIAAAAKKGAALPAEAAKDRPVLLNRIHKVLRAAAPAQHVGELVSAARRALQYLGDTD